MFIVFSHKERTSKMINIVYLLQNIKKNNIVTPSQEVFFGFFPIFYFSPNENLKTGKNHSGFSPNKFKTI